MTIPGINLQLLLSTAAAQRQLQQDMANAARRAGTQASNQFEASFRPRNIIADAIPFAASALASRGIGLIINSAQQMNQAFNATGQIYGEAADELNKFVQFNGRALGLAKKDAQDYVNQFGAILIGLELGQDRAADFSQELVKAGSALAAFRNTSVAQAINALQAGFRGEYDSLQRFIPEVSDLTLRNRALALGLAESRTAVTQQDKALALLDLVQKSVGRSAGAAELAQGNLQTRLNETKAQTVDAATALGQRLLPALEGTLDVVNTVHPATLLLAGGMLLMGRRMQSSAASSTGFIGSMRASATSSYALTTALARQQAQFAGLSVTQALANRAAIVANNQIIASSAAVQGSLTGLGATWGRLAGQMAAAATTGSLAARSLGVAAVAGRAAGLGLAAGVSALGGPLTIALTAATIGVGYFLNRQAKQRQESQRATAANKSYAESVAEIGDRTTHAARALAAKEVVDRGLAAQAARSGISVELVTSAYLDQYGAVDLLNKRIEDRIKKLRDERAAIVDAEGPSSERAIAIKAEIADLTDLQGKVGGNAKALLEARQKGVLFAEGLGIQSGAIGNVAAAFVKAEQASRDYKEAEDAITKGRQSALDASIAYEQALDDITEGIEKNGKTLDITTQKGRDNVSTVRELIQAAYDQAEADIARDGVISATTQNQIDSLQRVLEQMGFNKKEVEDLIGTYKRVPPEVVTQVKVLGAITAEGELNAIGQAAVRMIAQYNLTPTEAYGLASGRDPRAVFGSPAAARGRAIGGRIRGPGGPEEDRAGVFALSNDEYVLRAPAVKKIDRELGPHALDYINRTGDLPIGRKATGGRVNVAEDIAPRSYQSWPMLLERARTLEAAKKRQLEAAKLAAMASGGIPWDGTVQPGKLGEMQQWALAQAGKVYQWAAVGPNNYDCSGLVGNLWAIATGNPLYRRYFTTHNMGPGRFGMEKGPGKFTVYLKQGGAGGGHTSANIAGLHAEAYGGNGTPNAIGRIGTSLNYYDQVLHLAGMARGGRVRNDNDPGSSREDRIRSFFQRGWPEPPAGLDPRTSEHWAMDAGGIMNPDDVAKNYGRQPEAVLDAEDTVRFRALAGGEVAIRLDEYTIGRIAQALQSRPAVFTVDGKELARTVLDRSVI